MTYPHLVLVNWLALLLAIVASCQAMPAHAGQAYLDVAGGASLYGITAVDGDYIQRGLPHDLDRTSLAYRVELGWKFNERWSVQAGYLNLGTIKQDALFVDDRDYNAKAGTFTTTQGAPVPNKMTDAYRGLELTVARTFQWSDYALFLKGGGAWMEHKFTIVRMDTGGSHRHDGEYPAVVLGVGASYRWLYTELEYIHGIGGSNGFAGENQSWPLSKEQAVAWFGVKIPVGW